MLLSMLRKTTLSDNEFLVNLGDWPLSSNNRNHWPLPLPIFSWCGSAETDDIVLPTYEMTESILKNYDTIDVLSTFGKQSLPFTLKQNKLFWRGRDSNRARLHLIEQSFDKPDYFNVSITNFFFFRNEMHKYMSNDDNDNATDGKSSNTTRRSKYEPFMNFFKYRYQINIDGTVAAYRFPFLLSSNSLIIKQNSNYYEYFYSLLKDRLHIINIDRQLESLPNLIENLIQLNEISFKEFKHDNSIDPLDLTNQKNIENILKIKKIIWHARILALKYLLPTNIFCYYYNVFEAYQKLLLNPRPTTLKQRASKLGPEMELLLDGDENSYSNRYSYNLINCTCDKGQKQDPEKPVASDTQTDQIESISLAKEEL